MIEFSVEGAAIGDTIQLPPGGGTVHVEAVAESFVPIHRLEIVERGEVVTSTEEPNGSRRLELHADLRVGGDSWLAARCGGEIRHNDQYGRPIRADTSPIYLRTGREWSLADPRELEYMLSLIDGGLSFIRETALHHPPGTVIHHHGQDDHRAYLEQPFLEGREALHRRLHALGIPH
jgi:hypothetical protein